MGSTPPPTTLRFDLVDLKLFLNVAEANSLTRGAERSALSPAAVSLRIKNLEEALGAKLFYREKRGITTTEAGRVLLDHARQVLQQVDRLQADLQPYAQGLRGHVRLFASATASSELLPAVLARFFAAYPVISVDLQQRLSVEVVRAVQEGLADLGVISGRVSPEDLETFLCWKDRLVLAVPLDHPLAALAQVPLAEALAYDFVGLDSHTASYSFLQNEVSQLGRRMRQRILVGSFDAMCRMVEQGIGIGVLPEAAARRLVRSTAIRTVPLADAWAARELRVCVRRLDEMPVYARDLVEFFRQAAAHPPGPPAGRADSGAANARS